MDKTKLVTIFYITDEFNKQADQYFQPKNPPQGGKLHRNRESQISDSEVMTILIIPKCGINYTTRTHGQQNLVAYLIPNSNFKSEEWGLSFYPCSHGV